MRVLEQISNLKKQGISEDEIVNRLHQQGVSPKEIDDAIHQMQVKKSAPNMEPPKPGQGMDGMKPSMMQIPKPGAAPPKPQAPESHAPAPKTQEHQEPQFQQQPPQQFQPQNLPQENYNYSTETSTDTMIEIAGQIFEEKSSTISKQIRDMNEFKTMTQMKLENFSKRLEKIEAIIDKLQVAILQKVGSYGQDLNSIKKEMSMMQNSFGKMINPLLDKKSGSGLENIKSSKDNKNKQRVGRNSLLESGGHQEVPTSRAEKSKAQKIPTLRKKPKKISKKI